MFLINIINLCRRKEKNLPLKLKILNLMTLIERQLLKRKYLIVVIHILLILINRKVQSNPRWKTTNLTESELMNTNKANSISKERMKTLNEKNSVK